MALGPEAGAKHVEQTLTLALTNAGERCYRRAAPLHDLSTRAAARYVDASEPGRLQIRAVAMGCAGSKPELNQSDVTSAGALE